MMRGRCDDAVDATNYKRNKIVAQQPIRRSLHARWRTRIMCVTRRAAAAAASPLIGLGQ
jgi:hypothetical protein